MQIIEYQGAYYVIGTPMTKKQKLKLVNDGQIPEHYAEHYTIIKIAAEEMESMVRNKVVPKIAEKMVEAIIDMAYPRPEYSDD